MYSSSLSTAQYNLIKRYLPVVKSTRPRIYTEYELLNGIMYILVSGCIGLPRQLRLVVSRVTVGGGNYLLTYLIGIVYTNTLES